MKKKPNSPHLYSPILDLSLYLDAEQMIMLPNLARDPSFRGNL